MSGNGTVKKRVVYTECSCGSPGLFDSEGWNRHVATLYNKGPHIGKRVVKYEPVTEHSGRAGDPS